MFVHFVEVPRPIVVDPQLAESTTVTIAVDAHLDPVYIVGHIEFELLVALVGGNRAELGTCDAAAIGRRLVD